jgi:serine/threonine-protein kinase HipA
VTDQLAIWLHGVQVAVVHRERRRLQLSYTPDALRLYPLGAPLLSLSLPLTRERYTQAVVHPFLDGLLPEGDSRRVLAEKLNLLSSDTYGLIRALGRDCAGALVVQPAEDPAPPAATTQNAEPLDQPTLAHLVSGLHAAPLGVDARVRLSLAGVQEKLLLTRMADGSWGRPLAGAASTHILKPEIAGFAATVENEAFCMRVALHLGLPVASIDTLSVDGRKLIVVERYDRIVGSDGSVVRLHQEDLCQAIGIAPEQKYQDDGGPSLSRIAALLGQLGGQAALEGLLRAVTVTVVIGNGDAHAKNFSLVHAASGAVGLAPLYDLMCTLYYGDDRLAMHIDDVRRTNRVTGRRLVNEATRWGLPRSRAAGIVAELLDRVPACVDLARDQTPGLPDEIAVIVAEQLARLHAGL